MADKNSYYVGEQVRIQGIFKNAAGTAVDPGTVTVTYRDPSGTSTAYVYGTDPEVIKSATGTYYVDVTTDESGDWIYKFVGTVSGIGANESFFKVSTLFN